jgi:hypothetical protein
MLTGSRHEPGNSGSSPLCTKRANRRATDRNDSLADLLRQIGYDERLHKLESEANLSAPRFR